ncbi:MULTISPECIES: helix-turn-helix transcriptional regulator [Allobacillus]|uniref:Helix-turn-helix transcriptional regulator n=1 Tax=Allobacillus salarius TaxID=1955272 RepID=A0A556PR28_9BACI|nr:helix-turn-helix transcriptional regulator [Allobacillus salarius]TSJ66842.1 helix-turn-helix transcriptional regulator [Allobacillus salarius]
MKNRLTEIRKQHRMNQQELADVLEVTRQTIGSIENGRYDPSLQLAFKIARYFDMAIEEIFIDERGENDES